MKEIGGYFELESFSGTEYHSDALALNCGRNCVLFLIRLRGYKKVYIPDFMCSSIRNALDKNNIIYEIYSVNRNFTPVLDKEIAADEAVYIVNYYGQLRDHVEKWKKKWNNIIVDNAQDYFFSPQGVDTIYTCRKYFGVSDGAYLRLSNPLEPCLFYEELPEDESFDRIRFVLGRYERNASEFYKESADNNKLFADEPVKKMSMLTHNILRAVDYKKIENTRTKNFAFLHENLSGINLLKNLTIPNGAFMYPLLLENGVAIRRQLHSLKIFVPTLWPDVCEGEVALDYAANMLPIPCDQRYAIQDMKYIVNEIYKIIVKEV